MLSKKAIRLIFLFMYEHVFVITGRGAVSKKKDMLTITSQSHLRPKNPPKSAPNATALHRTPSTGHSGRAGPQNNQKVRLTVVRPELLLATLRFCLCRQLTRFGTEHLWLNFAVVFGFVGALGKRR